MESLASVSTTSAEAFLVEALICLMLRVLPLPGRAAHLHLRQWSGKSKHIPVERPDRAKSNPVQIEFAT